MAVLTPRPSRWVDEADEQADHYGGDKGEDRDRLVLPTQEGHRAFEDPVRDVLHLARAGISSQDVPGQIGGEGDRRQAYDEDQDEGLIQDLLHTPDSTLIRAPSRPAGIAPVTPQASIAAHCPFGAISPTAP